MLKTGNMMAGSQTGKYLQYMNTKKTRFTETLNPVRIVFGLTGENIYTQLYWKTDEDRTGVLLCGEAPHIAHSQSKWQRMQTNRKTWSDKRQILNNT